MSLLEARESTEGHESFSKIENRYLSPFEQKLIGSSVPGFDVPAELAQNHGSLPDSRFRPGSILEGISIEATNAERRTKYLVGVLTIYGPSNFLIPGDLVLVTKLPLMDTETGTTSQEWVSFIAGSNGRVNNNPDLLSRLSLWGKTGSNMYSWVEPDGIHAGFKPKS